MTLIPASLVCDTREQLAYSFEKCVSKHIAFTVEHHALDAGDYTSYLPDGPEPENMAVVERKTHSDLLGTLTHGRERFEAELERLSHYGFAAIVCETDLPSIVRGTSRPDSRVNPRSIIASLIAFAQRFNVHICFASNRQYAEAYTYRLLERWVRDRAEARKERNTETTAEAVA